MDIMPEPKTEYGLKIFKKSGWAGVRKAAVTAVNKGKSISGASRIPGASKSAVSKWYKKYRETGNLDSLNDKPGGPHRVVRKRDKYRQIVVEAGKKYPQPGCIKPAKILSISLSHQTIYRILVEEGLIKKG